MGKEKTKDKELEPTDQDLDAALNAGFEDDGKYVLPEEKPPVSDEDLAPAAKDNDLAPAAKDEDATPEIDEWEGISDSIKSKFEGMQTDLAKAIDIAKSASGRANKMQSAIDKQQAEPEAPKLTSDMILEAMSDKGKRDELREEFSEFANVFDEMDKSMSNAVGKAMDSRFESFRQEMASNNESIQARSDTQRSLDIAHPGWENTINDDSFKNWVYENGPSVVERSSYESLLTAGNADQASSYYNDLLTSYPVWAEKRGNLYGDPSGEAAIKLLSQHKENLVTSEQIRVNADKQSESERRLEANIAPTSGRSRQAPVAESEDADAAFLDGFKNG